MTRTAGHIINAIFFLIAAIITQTPDIAVQYIPTCETEDSSWCVVDDNSERVLVSLWDADPAPKTVALYR